MPTALPLWPGEAPGLHEADPAFTPTITPYPVAADGPVGAVIVLPGGGPKFLFWLIIASWGIGAITLAIYERARWKPSLAPPVSAPAQ